MISHDDLSLVEFQSLDDGVAVVVGQTVLVDLEIRRVGVDRRTRHREAVVLEQDSLEFGRLQFGEFQAEALVPGQQLEGFVRVARAYFLLTLVEQRECLLDQADLLRLRLTFCIDQIGSLVVVQHVVAHFDSHAHAVDYELHALLVFVCVGGHDLARVPSRVDEGGEGRQQPAVAGHALHYVLVLQVVGE